MAMLHLDADSEHIVRALSQQIAKEFGLDFVSTEHILLAILRHGKGVGAAVLRELGLTEARVHAEVDRAIRDSKEDTWVFGRLPGSPHYRNVVALAIDEATQLEAKSIGTEHLLLALLREKDSMAQEVLDKLGVTLGDCRTRILRRLS